MKKTIPLLCLVIGISILACNNADKFRHDTDAPSVQQLLTEIADDRRFIAPEELASSIINQDPSLILIDVRTAEEFDDFALPEAIHIPIVDLKESKNITDLDCKNHKLVFYANASILPDQAWMVSRSLGCEESYILRGGLNAWFDDILDPQKPMDTESAEAIEQYNLRVGMKNYFLGLSKELSEEPFISSIPKKVITPKAKKKAAVEEEEGC